MNVQNIKSVFKRAAKVIVSLPLNVATSFGAAYVTGFCALWLLEKVPALTKLMEVTNIQQDTLVEGLVAGALVSTMFAKVAWDIIKPNYKAQARALKRENHLLKTFK
ncbi:MAG: hypothetical protein CMH30_08690 [Micavibrio sp.]|nr:hypothetical protein [Micavibrio sp.]